jgi:type I restriction enzyme S subunit
MSRVDDLIADLCPGGVEFWCLKDVARIRNGKDYKNFGQGDVPVYGTGGVMTKIDTAAYEKPSVLIPRKGSLNKLYYVDGPFWTVDTIFYTEIIEALIEPKFFYYFLMTQRLEELNQAGGVPSLTQSVLNELKIPVPPLEVQREIVKVLDTFTKLEAELEAELEARSRQYAYYRDALLAFKKQNVRWATMSEVGEFFRGRRFTKDDYVLDGIGCIHYGDIYTQYGIATTSTVSHVRSDMASALRFAKPGDLVIAGVGETVEDVGKAVAWLGDGEVAIHDDCFAYRHSLNPKFVSYYFQTAAFHAEKNKYVARAKVKRLSAENLGKLAIPIPPLDEQVRIVAILDKFDALVNDLGSGLPAEIKARRQQYEHYRDCLLSFREVV